MDAWMRTVLIGMAEAFIDMRAARSENYIRADDFHGDDPVPMPKGKAVKITFEFVDEGVLCDGGGE